MKDKFARFQACALVQMWSSLFCQHTMCNNTNKRRHHQCICFGIIYFRKYCFEDVFVVRDNVHRDADASVDAVLAKCWRCTGQGTCRGGVNGERLLSRSVTPHLKHLATGSFAAGTA